jgi:Ca2+-binding EF-hand superfamily protein
MNRIHRLSMVIATSALLSAAVVHAQDDQPDRDERRARALEEYDSDGDGVLSNGERDALHEARDGSHKGKKGRRLERFDSDGDGQLSDSERTAAREKRGERQARALERFDADGDGQLSGSEKGAARAARGGRGPGGNGGGRGNHGEQ